MSHGAARYRLAAIAVFALTVAQLLVASLLPDLEQFEGKAFGWRLLAYPLMMLAVPVAWWVARRRAARTDPVPWAAFALVMLPFLVDVTGNTLNLYDTVGWWDDANHFVNWIFLCAGLGLIICRNVERTWQVVLIVAGLGAMLAIAWELGEWFAFIRHGTEIDTAYEDTLSDEALGTLGGFVAAVIVARWRDLTRLTPEAPRGRSTGDRARRAGPAATGD